MNDWLIHTAWFDLFWSNLSELFCFVFCFVKETWKYICIFLHFSTLRWHKGSRSRSTLKIHSSYFVNTLAADALATPGARVSAVMLLTLSSSKQYSIHSTSIMVSSKHQEFKPLRWLEFLMLWRYHNLHQGIWINLSWQSNSSFIWFSSPNGNLYLSDAVHQTWQGNRNIWRLPRKLLLFLAT